MPSKPASIAIGNGPLQGGRLRTWQWLHKWSSLVCTFFLLIICVTGLPLVFHDEIDALTAPPPVYENLPAATANVSLNRLVEISRKEFPGQVITFIFADDDEPQVYIYLAPSFEAVKADDDVEHFLRFDSRTGKIIGRSKPEQTEGISFLGVMLRLHVNLFADFPGQLFMGFMGVLFLIAIVSGVVLYGPFTRKLQFGAVRTERTARVRWLDLHNLLGVVTILWAGVVGITGVMNELASPMVALWQGTDVRAMLAPYAGRQPVQPGELAQPQAVLDAAKAALPGMVVTSITYPGGERGSPYHFLVWAKGSSPLTERLSSPVLVDGRSGKVTTVVKMPWYLRALELSRPLHFGDYGGLPLKILWALLDLVTIVVLGSGLYLWIARPRRQRAAAAREGLHGASPVMEPAE